MANLSYCRFRNTSEDLNDCSLAQCDWRDDPQEYKDLSSGEKEAYEDLIMTARDMVRLHDKLTSEGLFDDENEEDEDLE